MFRALIVDDEPLVRESIVRLVQWDKYHIDEIREASDGVMALEMIREYMPDLIFCDMYMNKLDGVGLLQALEELGYSGSVIVISGYEDSYYMKKAIRYGSVDYILKPINREELNSAIERALKRLPVPEQRKKTEDPVETYIQENYMKNITLEELAKQFFVSREHLSRTFKRRTGKNIFQYVMDIRLAKSRELLKRTNKNIEEIALAVGFSSGNYFSKVFYKKEGISPTEYRRNINKLP